MVFTILLVKGAPNVYCRFDVAMYHMSLLYSSMILFDGSRFCVLYSHEILERWALLCCGLWLILRVD